MDKAAAMWKDKGCFEGLMSNPAFTMGLAFMQAGANGKTLGQDALNNVVKAAGISAEFKDRIAARKQAPIQATAADIEEVKGVLSTLVDGFAVANYLKNNHHDLFNILTSTKVRFRFVDKTKQNLLIGLSIYEGEEFKSFLKNISKAFVTKNDLKLLPLEKRKLIYKKFTEKIDDIFEEAHLSKSLNLQINE